MLIDRAVLDVTVGLLLTEQLPIVPEKLTEVVGWLPTREPPTEPGPQVINPNTETLTLLMVTSVGLVALMPQGRFWAETEPQRPPPEKLAEVMEPTPDESIEPLNVEVQEMVEPNAESLVGPEIAMPPVLFGLRE